MLLHSFTTCTSLCLLIIIFFNREGGWASKPPLEYLMNLMKLQYATLRHYLMVAIQAGIVVIVPKNANNHINTRYSHCTLHHVWQRPGLAPPYRNGRSPLSVVTSSYVDVDVPFSIIHLQSVNTCEEEKYQTENGISCGGEVVTQWFRDVYYF